MKAERKLLTPTVDINGSPVGNMDVLSLGSTEENGKLTVAAAFYLLMMDVFKKVLRHELISFSF